MTIASIIIAGVIIAAIVYWFVRSEQKEAHHLDELHITPPEEKKKE